HALRAFTPKDQKTIKAVAAGFPANPAFDTAEVLTQLGTGEALVSVLAEDGRPTAVARALIAPPEGQIGPLDPAQRTALIQRSPVKGKYDQAVDRESAHELLKARAESLQSEQAQAAAEREAALRRQQQERQNRGRGGQRQSMGEALAKSAARSIGSQLGRQIIRGLMGAMFGKR
ncbi:MAG: DUF853 family protein, partial [Desulfobacterales bacterium]|nr:DUF853 family protein [Desulfobacterales bacterium]